MISLDYTAPVSERIPARKAEKVLMRIGHVNIISIMQFLTGTPKNYSVKVLYVIIDHEIGIFQISRNFPTREVGKCGNWFLSYSSQKIMVEKKKNPSVHSKTFVVIT